MESQQPVQQIGQYPGLPPFFVPEAPKRPRTPGKHIVGALAVFTLGLGLAGYSLAISRSEEAAPAPPSPSRLKDDAARAVWRTTPVENLFPSRITRPGDEPADQYVRLGIAAPAGCDILPRAFRTALTTAAPATHCVTVLRSTYTDSTRTILATVGIVVIDGPASARDKVWRQWTPDSDAKNPELMPDVYPVEGTPAAKFADAHRVTWTSQPTVDGAFLTYVVTGFADGRAGSTNDQLASDTGKALAADSPPVQAAVDLAPTFVKVISDLEKNGSVS